jgi:hypothetical protein
MVRGACLGTVNSEVQSDGDVDYGDIWQWLNRVGDIGQR